MEQMPLVDTSLRAIFFDNDIENGQHPELFQGILASSDLEIAFAVTEAHLGKSLDLCLNRVVSYLAQRSPSATCELVETLKAVNMLRRSKYIEYFIQDQVLGHLKSTIRTF